MNERAKLLHSLTIERADTRVSPPRRRLWPVVAATSLGVVVVMAGLAWYFAPELASLRPVEQAAAVAPVSSPPSSATAAAADATRGGLVASGYVVARRKATVAAEVTGKVVEVLVDEGMVVEAGQVLARLDDVLADKDLRAGAGRASRRPRPPSPRSPPICRRRAHPQSNPDAVGEELTPPRPI